MTSEGTAPPNLPTLDHHERRVLGVLIEKAKTTPDSYPLSLNALVTGCNQKSAREPVMQLNDIDVEDTLARLQKKGLATRVIGTRVDRWRHDLYEAWHLDRIDLALVCELLLRGPQTEGELRGHAGRMESFEDLDALRKAINPLVDRGFVVYLSPQGKRGTTLTHAFHTPEELERLRQRARTEELAAASTPPSPSGTASETARGEVAQLRELIADLQQSVAALSQRVRSLEASLGQ
jgi:uncharacterized protein YceH (UPF0502 family)